MKRGDVYWCNFEGIGREQSGRRPCVIVSNDSNNKFSNVLTVVPMTSQIKNDLPVHCEIYINNIKNTILTEQITSVDKSRIDNYITNLPEKELKMVYKCLLIQLGFKLKEETK